MNHTKNVNFYIQFPKRQQHIKTPPSGLETGEEKLRPGSAQIFSGDAPGIFPDLLGGAGSDDLSAGFPAARAHIDDVVGVADHIQVVLDHHHSGALFDEGLEHAQQSPDLQRMQADGGFIKDKDGIRLAPAHLAGRWASPPDRLGVASPRVR